MVPVPYRYERTFIGLGIDKALFAGFPSTAQWAGESLLKKDEFHMTICSGEEIFAAAGLEVNEGEKKLLDFFNTFVAERPITLQSFVPDLRYAVDDARGRKSILVRCIASNLDTYFAELNRTFNVGIPMQPAHVTLYTLEKNVGIHINSYEKMERLERVQLPALEEALKNVHLV